MRMAITTLATVMALAVPALFTLPGCGEQTEKKTAPRPTVKSIVYKAMTTEDKGVKFYARKDGNAILQRIDRGVKYEEKTEGDAKIQVTVDIVEDRRHQLDLKSDDWERLAEQATEHFKLREFEEPPVDMEKEEEQRIYGAYMEDVDRQKVLLVTWSDGVKKTLKLPRDRQNMLVRRMFSLVEQMIRIYENPPFDREEYDPLWRPAGY